MNSSELRWWLHGFNELSRTKRFTEEQVNQVLEHIAIIEDSDEFVHWLKGTLELAKRLRKETSSTTYLTIVLELDKYFRKITPDTTIKKGDIEKAVDETLQSKEGFLTGPIKVEIDAETLKKYLEEARNTVNKPGFDFMNRDPFYNWDIKPICNHDVRPGGGGGAFC